MLNLKDLLAVFPPRLKRSLENEPVLRPLFRAESRQIPPFSSENVQLIAENGWRVASKKIIAPGKETGRQYRINKKRTDLRSAWHNGCLGVPTEYRGDNLNPVADIRQLIELTMASEVGSHVILGAAKNLSVIFPIGRT